MIHDGHYQDFRSKVHDHRTLAMETRKIKSGSTPGGPTDHIDRRILQNLLPGIPPHLYNILYTDGEYAIKYLIMYNIACIM